MRTRWLLIVALVIIFASESIAHDDAIAEGRSIIEQGIACSQLTDEQLEAVGEYYMEQMHPGTAHELMDNMMGGEGSKSLRRVHIAMAQRLYCNENLYVGYGMMGPGMMGYSLGGMMGGYQGYGNYSYWNIFQIIFFVAVILFIMLIVYRIALKKTAASATPLSILKKRLAKGEITKKQFDAIKHDLEV